MAAMASDWLKNWKSLKIFFKTTGWNETKFVPNTLWNPFKIVFVDLVNYPR
jgi:hypothetical protein